MTLQNSISADKNNNFKYLLGTLKSGWTHGVISFSAMFFLGPVLLLLACNSYDATIYRPAKNIEGLVATIYETYSLYCVAAAIIAVFFAIAMFHYLNSRVSVNFYHSLPFKRTRMFFTNWFSGIAMFTLGFLANYIICIIIPAVTGMGFSECLPAITSVFINALIYFILIYSMTVLIGMTTGLAPVQWLMTIGAFAILPVVKVCVNLLKGFHNSRYWIDYFLEYDKLLPTSPVVILFENQAFTLKTKIVFIIVSALCTLLAVVLYHYRLSEKSGNPFVFSKFASTVKYLAMFPASMGFAIIFGYMGDQSFIWLVFGSISGSVVAWMIMNSIINKTARAMFTAVRGMIIFTAAVTLFNIFLVYGVYSVENLMLNDKLVKSVSVEVDGTGEYGRLTFEDDETKGALIDIIRMEMGMSDDDGIDFVYDHSSSYPRAVAIEYNTKPVAVNDGNITLNGKDYYIGYQGADYVRIRAVAKTLFGYEIARSFGISDRVHDYFKELEIIANSDEYKEEILETLEEVKKEGRIQVDMRPSYISDGEIRITDSNIFGFNDYGSLYYDETVHGNLFGAYAKDIESISFEYYNAPVIGQIFIRDRNYNTNINLPITTKFTNTLEYFAECGIINSVDYAKDLTKAVRQVHVYDYLTNRVMTVTDDDEKLEEIFESVDTYDIYNQYSSFFNTVDHRYKVFFDYKYTEEYKYEEYTTDIVSGEAATQLITETSENSGVARAEFISGKVPAFVEEYFAY